MLILVLNIIVTQDILENVADDAHFNIVHKPTILTGLNFNSNLSEKISKYFRIEWESNCSEDLELKHILHIKAITWFYEFGYKFVELKVHIRDIGPAHFLSMADIIIWNRWRISVLTSLAIITTGPLTQRMIFQFHSGSSFWGKIFLGLLLKKAVSINVSNQGKLNIKSINSQIMSLCNSPQ